MWKEFKEFAVKGNAIDLAVGVIIGAAFGSVIGSLVKDVIMPPIGLLTGGLDFSNQVPRAQSCANRRNDLRLRLTQQRRGRSHGTTATLSRLLLTSPLSRSASSLS